MAVPAGADLLRCGVTGLTKRCSRRPPHRLLPAVSLWRGPLLNLALGPRGGRMTVEDLFPPDAIRILRSARWDCGATKAYEAQSGGFWWSDEFPDGLVEACHKVGS